MNKTTASALFTGRLTLLCMFKVTADSDPKNKFPCMACRSFPRVCSINGYCFLTQSTTCPYYTCQNGRKCITFKVSTPLNNKTFLDYFTIRSRANLSIHSWVISGRCGRNIEINEKQITELLVYKEGTTAILTDYVCWDSAERNKEDNNDEEEKEATDREEEEKN